MKKTSLKIKILSGMLCTGLALSGTSLSLAAVKDTGSAKVELASSMDVKVPMDKENIKEERQAEMKATLDTVINESVGSGIITKEEGDKVLEYVKTKSQKRSEENKTDKKCKNGKCEGAKGGLFNDLVTDGVLTQEKSNALKERMYVKHTQIRTEKLEKGLNTLVASKVLTNEQSVKVKEAIMARDAERKENYNKMKDMNEKERKDYMKKIKSDKVNPMKVLLDNKTITKEQEKEIQKVLPHYNHGKHGHHWEKQQ
ncbi:hypothetical protein G9F72_023115 [Clostridium estertheticum]|uniref:hypothetical protein n=1 Tax=Clostridium estertheticum TaxID=238834 RepID=UPI0013E99E19|nr:hypothetical protein [Clostridium estertheticum]MBZ9689193.1 hypothetical protein [Clostridium estertheticum]